MKNNQVKMANTVEAEAKCNSDCDDNVTNFSRRRFLLDTRGVVLGAAASSLVLPNLAYGGYSSYNSSDSSGSSCPTNFSRRTSFQEVRRAFNTLNTYLNTGFTGPKPCNIIENYAAYNQIIASDPDNLNGTLGGVPIPAVFHKLLREEMAGQVNATPGQFALTNNTTDGLEAVLHGVEFEDDDVVITTQNEFISVTGALSMIRDRNAYRGINITVKVVNIPIEGTGAIPHPTAQDYVDVFADALNEFGDRVRLVVFSHITSETGTQLPAKDICTLANMINEDRNNRGVRKITTVVDGAHALGMIELDLPDMGCDFYAASGHKWQCGPGGTGILYIREGDSASVPNGIPGFWTTQSFLYNVAPVLPPVLEAGTFGALMTARAEPNYAAMQALRDSFRMWDSLGRDRIEEYSLGLSSFTKDRLRKVFSNGNLVIYSPDTYELSSGMTVFNPFYDQNDESLVLEVRDRLRSEFAFAIRSVSIPLENGGETRFGLRISTHLFNNQRQVKQLIRNIRTLVQEIEGS